MPWESKRKVVKGQSPHKMPVKWGRVSGSKAADHSNNESKVNKGGIKQKKEKSRQKDMDKDLWIYG